MFNIKSSSSQFVSFPAGSACKQGGKTAMVGKGQLFLSLFSTQGCLQTVHIVQSHQSHSPRRPVQEWLLKCERSSPSAPRSPSGHPLLPCPCCTGQSPVPRGNSTFLGLQHPAQGGCTNHGFSFAGVLPPLCWCWYQITTGNSCFFGTAKLEAN